jgi:hypothetical protein
MLRAKNFDNVNAERLQTINEVTGPNDCGGVCQYADTFSSKEINILFSLISASDNAGFNIGRAGPLINW